MTYVLCGALGVLIVLGLFAVGLLAGWKVHAVWREHACKSVAEEATEEQRKQLEAEQRAFEGMLNYNIEQAYGMSRGLEELDGGDR